MFGEFHRLLGPGGQLVLAFQVGDERVHVEQAYGHVVSADVYRLPPDHVADLMGRAGFVVHTRLVREQAGAMEKTPQAYLMAHKPADQ